MRTSQQAEEDGTQGRGGVWEPHFSLAGAGRGLGRGSAPVLPAGEVASCPSLWEAPS